ncbi:alanine--tRNA ligase, cytoplasmic-like isoform X2 [Littorina saxatilis]|uniref:alanine--tRNA ligase, cytoplasmic-like isoform X2 n=1 Tax=Littorina saxatilis TaxID=31220 RepID=UPI0038B5235B
MLSNWSFGDYFKEQACKMAFELLTSVYGLPAERLYFTYFGGNTALNLQPDDECREIWRSLGIPAERVLPFGMRDNFWDMGDTGPCGPCTEIHYDHAGVRDGAGLVNADHPEVVEIWNLVFMQYQRQENGTLSKLPQHHVDTGMGLERILAVLNGSRSNYDTDLFQPLFAAIQKASGARAYGGKVGQEDTTGTDTAYRVLADHARMYTVAIADGLMPSRNGLGHKLRQLIYRCVRYSHNTFKADPHLLCDLVDCVSASLGEAFPEISKRKDVIKSAVAMTVEGYLQLQKEARQAFVKMLKQCDSKHLSGEVMWQLSEGKYGCSVPVDLMLDLAEEHGVSLDLQEFEQRLQHVKEQQSHVPLIEEGVISQRCYESLQKQGVTATDDSFKYQYSSSESGYDFSECQDLACRVVGLIKGQEVTAAAREGSKVAVILDRTCFYAEGGGQVADRGRLVCQGGQFAVEDVQEYNGYVIHLGTLVSGSLVPGDIIHPVVSQEERVACMRNHTATHLLQAALRQHLGASVMQQGSNVRSDRLSFDFLCLEKLTKETVKEIESSVRQFVRQGHEVCRRQMSLQEALNSKEIVTVPNEEYPPEVTLVQIGDLEDAVSGELCGGTHVLNTGDIEDFCITRVSSVSQGVRRVFGVTGHTAAGAHENGTWLMELCQEFSDLVASQSCSAAELTEKSQRIKQMLDTELLPHYVRDHGSSVVETLAQYVAATANRERQAQMRRTVEDLLRCSSHAPFVVHSTKFDGKQMIKALSSLEAGKPVALVSCEKKSAVVVMVLPKEQPADKIQTMLTEAIGGSHQLKVKSTVNDYGTKLVQVTVKGTDLSDWLEHKVTDVMTSLSR